MAELTRAAIVHPPQNVSLDEYYRNLEHTRKKANKKLLESDFKNAYIYYLRYATMVIQHLKNIPGYNEEPYKEQHIYAGKHAKDILNKLERLQVILGERHLAYRDYMGSLPRPKAQVTTYLSAMKKKIKERGRSSGSSSGKPKIRLEEEKEEVTDGGFNMAESLQGLDIKGSNEKKPSPAVVPKDVKEALLIEYPAVHDSKQPSQMPSLPPRRKNAETDSHSNNNSSSNISPPICNPDNIRLLMGEAHHSPSMPQEQQLQQPQLPPKPQEYYNLTQANTVDMPLFASPDSYFSTEGGSRMRPVQLPSGLIEEFMDIASANTRHNLETCGILCGKPVPSDDGVLAMTTLIMPKQSATSDTCTTEHEEELFREQMARDLITLGWIHTHPSQTCFMSSLDLHTHCSYQLMLPEAVAVVCAPQHTPNFGVFRLTDPTGLGVIQACRQTTNFHPHDESQIIYTDADHGGGHVVLANYDFDIVDIR